MHISSLLIPILGTICLSHISSHVHAEDGADEIATTEPVPVAMEMPTITPAGLSIAHPLLGQRKKSHFHSWKTGITIAALASLNNGMVIELIEDKCRVDFLQDDQGTDLMVASNPDHIDNFKQPGIHGERTRFKNASEDDQGADNSYIFTINGPRAPAADATSIRCKGTVTLKCASNKNSEDIADISNTVGTAIQSKSFSFKIIEANDVKAIRLETTSDMSSVISFSFIDADGEKIRCHRNRTSTSSTNGKTTYKWQYLFSEKIEIFGLHIEAWTDTQEFEIPFYFNTSLGIGAE